MLRLKCCPREDLLDCIGEKRIVCFGAGKNFSSFLKYYEDSDVIKKIECILDNNVQLDGTVVNGFSICSIKSFMNKGLDNYVVVVTNVRQCCDIVTQLDNIPFFNEVDCYINTLNALMQVTQPINFTKAESMIPKKIHYFWFGRKPIPSNLQMYIDGWAKWCPEYEIIQWNEDNYDVTKNQYMLQAYRERKYGFVPDYARLDVIYRYGGIYLDVDVELVRSLDALLGEEMFCGFESDQRVNLGHGFGAVKGHSMLKKFMTSYENMEFVKEGIINYTPSPVYQSLVLEQQGFKMDGTYQSKDGVTIFPKEFFAPGDGIDLADCITQNTFSIHHFESSWVQDRDEIRRWRKEMECLYRERIELYQKQ